MNSRTATQRIAARIALILLFTMPLLVLSATAYDFMGTVMKVAEPNAVTVNVTQSGTYGLQATVEVLFDGPLTNLASFKGKELQFEILGHDILGRPVCEAYLNDINIRDIYNGWQNPVYYGYHTGYVGWEWAGRYYMPCFGQCRSYYPYF